MNMSDRIHITTDLEEEIRTELDRLAQLDRGEINDPDVLDPGERIAALKWVLQRAGLVAALLLAFTAGAGAQPLPVNKWADWSSYGTAGVNTTIGVVDAWQSERRGCHLGQLALAEGLGNGLALIGQHTITSPRPCCPGNGLPSQHVTNSVIGLNQAHPASSWKGRVLVGVTMVALTGLLRWQANRHTWEQIGWGALTGLVAELGSHWIVRCDDGE